MEIQTKNPTAEKELLRTNKLYLSVSKLEKFRRYVQQVTDFDTEQSLIDTLMGVYEPNYKAKFGTCYGALIENPEKYFDAVADEYSVPLTATGNLFDPESKYQNDQTEIAEWIHFNHEQAEPAIRYHNAIKPAFYEVPGYYTIKVGEYEVTLSFRIDVIHGAIIRDIKCSFREPDYKGAYLDSVQWKIYLLATGLDEFYYDHFHIKERVSGNHVIELIDPSLMCVKYPQMESEVQQWMRSMITWTQKKGLFHLLQSKI